MNMITENETIGETFEKSWCMAPFEIDIDLCLKNRKSFKITTDSKILRSSVLASCLDELQWLSKSKLNLNRQAKVSMFLEKDGTEVDDQKFFETLSEHTHLVAKEERFITDDDIKQFPKNLTTDKGFKNVQIKISNEFDLRRNIGLKLSGKFISM